MKSQAIALFFAASLILSVAAWGESNNRSYQGAGNQLAQSLGGYQTVAYDQDKDNDKDRDRRDADRAQDQREWKALLERQKDERQACRKDRDDRRCKGLLERQKDERQNFKRRERREDHSQNFRRENNRRGDRD